MTHLIIKLLRLLKFHRGLQYRTMTFCRKKIFAKSKERLTVTTSDGCTFKIKPFSYVDLLIALDMFERHIISYKHIRAERNMRV